MTKVVMWMDAFNPLCIETITPIPTGFLTTLLFQSSLHWDVAKGEGVCTLYAEDFQSSLHWDPQFSEEERIWYKNFQSSLHWDRNTALKSAEKLPPAFNPLCIETTSVQSCCLLLLFSFQSSLHWDWHIQSYIRGSGTTFQSSLHWDHST